MSLSLPALDARLALRGRIAEGGMGEVHRAWDEALERAVAVKFLRGSDPREAERLLLEARLQARVEHANVVRIHEVGTLGGRPCIVMQLVEGGTLADHGPGTPLDLRLGLLRDAAQGLHAAHLQGLVHRDVKPGNILVERGEDGALRGLVSDFGLARDEGGGLSRSGLPAGTLDFMAPELLLEPGPVDFRVDVYALGATAYAVFSGRLPFRAPTAEAAPDQGLPAEDGTLFLRRILEEEPTPIAGLHPDLATLVAKAMEKAPGDRIPTALAFAEDLDRVLRGEPILARPAPPLDRLARWTRRNRLAARLSLAGLAALLLGLAFGAWTLRRAERQSLASALLGSEAAHLETLLREEQLLPPHDLRPALARIRTTLAELPRRAADAPGPAAFVEGRGLQLLGDPARARVALLRAWDLGFRTPAAARALGEAEAACWEVERATLPRFEDPAKRKSALEDLQRRFRDPALARLKSVPSSGPADQALLEARIALVEERFPEAARRAAEAASHPNFAAQAFELRGQALLKEGLRLSASLTQDAAAIERLGEALDALQRASAIARSAQAPRLHAADALFELAMIAQRNPRRSGPMADLLAPVDAALEEARRLNPEQEAYLRLASEVEGQRGQWLKAAGRPFLEATLQAVRLARQALAASFDPRKAVVQLAWECVVLTRAAVDEHLLDPTPYWQEGLAATARARRLMPENSGAISIEKSLQLGRSAYLTARGEDGLPDAQAALANLATLRELGGNPVSVADGMAEARMALGRARLARGEEATADFAEALRAAGEVIRLTAGQNANGLIRGLYIGHEVANHALLDGSLSEADLATISGWSKSLEPLAGKNLFARNGTTYWAVVQAKAVALRGGDPRPLLDRAEPRLLELARSGAFIRVEAWLQCSEAALTLAEWLEARGRDPGAARMRALEAARAARRIDAQVPRAALLEGRALLLGPRRDPDAAAALAEQELGRHRHDAEAWLLLARARFLAGQRDPAREALAQAERFRPRLRGLAELRGRLGQG